MKLAIGHAESLPLFQSVVGLSYISTICLASEILSILWGSICARPIQHNVLMNKAAKKEY